jgi:hypothetical protein
MNRGEGGDCGSENLAVRGGDSELCCKANKPGIHIKGFQIGISMDCRSPRTYKHPLSLPPTCSHVQVYSIRIGLL